VVRSPFAFAPSTPKLQLLTKNSLGWEDSFVKRDLWERGLRFVDYTSGAVPDLVKKFLSTQLNIHCPNFQQNCVPTVGRLIKKRLNGMLHNVTSKYRAKLADMSKYNTVVGFFNATQMI
jgi:hypothetical protein